MAIERSGNPWRTSGWFAVSVFLANAPMERPPPEDRIWARFSRVISTSSVGRSMSSFIRSRMFVPPATNFAVWFRETVCTAVAGSSDRTYLNGRIVIALLTHHRGYFLSSSEVPCLRPLSTRLNFLDRRDNARICTATTYVAAHAFADLFVGQF